MSRSAGRSAPFSLSKGQARRLWLRAQRLDRSSPFGNGADATRLAVEHLGYVQIDTINVIERAHHHILYSRIPTYRRTHLHHAQTVEKSVFEYVTHALSYIPIRDIRFFLSRMRQNRLSPSRWFEPVSDTDLRRVLARIRRLGPLSIRDIDDDVLVEKDHPWASRKPSKRALQCAFYGGTLTISERQGMLMTYELTARHFGWERPPRAATPQQITQYILERALRAQGVVSLDSICYLDAKSKPAIRKLIEQKVRRRQLLPVRIEGIETIEHWAQPEVLDEPTAQPGELVHILSPFDPLIIQRKRLLQIFDYEHRFEAYLPKEKRIYGYFGLPVLVDDRIVAVIDLKTDRIRGQLLVQKWSWMMPDVAPTAKALIEQALHRFETFQLEAPERPEDSAICPGLEKGTRGEKREV